MGKPVKFKAILQEAAVGTGGAFVLFPFDIKETFGTTGRIPIKATVNGEPYRGSLVKYGHPQHMLPVLKAIREKIGKNIGDTIEVIIEKDTTAREIEIPEDLQKVLKENKMDKAFEKLSYTHRREYVQWIEAAKKPETRENRITKAVDMLKQKHQK